MNKLKQNLLPLLQKYKHGVLLSYFILYLAWFGWLEQKVTTNFHVIHMDIDDYIPFIEAFIVPYLLWFLYVAVVVAFQFFKDVPAYYKNCAFLFTGMTIFLIVSTIYPNGHLLRPASLESDTIFAAMIEGLWKADTSTNLFPSIHVYNSIASHIAVCHTKGLKDKKWVVIPSFILMLSICCATVFLKQHSMFDVITALVLAFVMYEIVYKADWNAIMEKRRERQKEKALNY